MVGAAETSSGLSAQDPRVGVGGSVTPREEYVVPSGASFGDTELPTKTSATVYLPALEKDSTKRLRSFEKASLNSS